MAPSRQLPSLTDDLMEEIFIRIACPAALTRVSAASVAFRRLTTDRTFLRRYRTRHPLLLLRFLDFDVSKGFYPVEAPHPGAPAGRAIANSSVVDYLPQDKTNDWTIRDVREGRVLIECSDAYDPVLPDFAVWDPLSRRYIMLPPMPLCEDQEELDLQDVNVVFAPCAEEDGETSFRVIGAMNYKRKLVVLVFESGSGRRTASTSANWDDLSLSDGIILCPLLGRPYYAYGSFYWTVIGDMKKLLKLDISRRELSTIDLPPNPYNVWYVVVVEAEEGRLGMFSCTGNNKFLNYYCYNNMQNEDRRANKWQMKNSIRLPVPDNLRIFGAQHGYIFLKSSSKFHDSEDTTCYSLEINTLKLERAIQLSRYCLSEPYFCIAPSMSPRV